MEARDEQKKSRNIVTETVFAGEKVKEFAGKQAVTVLAPVLAPVARFTEHLFVGDGPGNTGYRQTEYKQISKLLTESH